MVEPAVRVLGPVELRDRDGRAAAAGTPQQRVVLALLTLRAGVAVPVDAIVDAVWGDRAPRTARNLVQGYVARLRKVLGPALVSTSAGYLVDPAGIDSDVARLAELRAAAYAAGPATAARLLREALELWPAEALAGLPDTPGLLAERERLAALRTTLVEERIDADLATGHAAGDLVVELAELVRAAPLREGLWIRYLRALHADGRTADALAAYRTARRTFRDELGVDPPAELVALERSLLRQELPRRTVGSVVPAPRDSFVGRGAELARTVELVGSARLVTVVGPGGCGKTRLTAEVARSLRDRHPDGVWWVELAAVRDPAAAVAAALGLAPRGGQPWTEVIAGYLTGSRALIVLDNCEHVVEDVAVLADAVLTWCPEVRLLATSREPLVVGGEVTVRLTPLAAADAAALFVDRAGGLPPDPAAVDEVCRRLDGLPLAIELAASRVPALSLADLAGRLGEPAVLRGSRAAPARHRSLHALVGWSYDLLSAAEQRLFTQLSVFAGSFPLAAAEAFAPAEVLAALVDRSLVVRADIEAGTGSAGGPGRYRLLETLREFAAEHLADPEKTRLRHAEFYAGWLAAAAPPIYGPGRNAASTYWADALDVERADLTAALRWTVASRRPQLTAAIMFDAAALWIGRGPTAEGRAFAEYACGEVEEKPVRMRMALWTATLAHQQGDLAGSRAYAQEWWSLATELGDDEMAADALTLLAMNSLLRGDQATALADGERAHALAVATGNRQVRMRAVINLGRLALDRGEHDTAAALLEEGAAEARRLDSPLFLGFALDMRSALARRRGEPGVAALAADALAAYRACGSNEGVASVLRVVGQLADDPAAAAAAYAERLEICRRIGSRGGAATALEDLAGVAATLGRDELAGRLLGAAAGARDRIGAPVQAGDRPSHDDLLDGLDERLGAPARHAAVAAGRMMSIDEAAAEVRAAGWASAADAGGPEAP